MVRISQCMPSDRLSTEGRWFEWVNGVRFRILPSSAEVYLKRMLELREPYRKAIAIDPESEEARACLAQIVRKASAALVVDVRNVEDDDGTPIEFSREWLEEVLDGPAGSDLSEFILRSAANQSAFTRAADLLDEGNSEGRSAGA